MAKKRETSARIRRLLRETISDRELAEVFEAAVLAGDQGAAGRAYNEAADRSSWGILDRKKFPVSGEVLEKWQALKAQALPRDFDFITPEIAGERKKFRTAFERAIKRLETFRDEIAAGKPLEFRTTGDSEYHRLARGAEDAASRLRGIDQTESLAAFDRLQAITATIEDANTSGVEARRQHERDRVTTERDKARAEYARDPALGQYRSELAQLAQVLGPRRK